MKTLLGAFLSLIISVSNAADAIVYHLDNTDTTFQVTLPANPTTGYQWSLKTFDSGLLRLVSSKYIPPETKLIGAGGNMVYNFELINGAKIPKMTSLVFNYAQPWQSEKATIQTVTVTFNSNMPVTKP